MLIIDIDFELIDKMIESIGIWLRQASSPHHQICFGFVSDGETSLATPLERVQNL